LQQVSTQFRDTQENAMPHAKTTPNTHLIALSIAALMTFTIAVGIPALGHYEANRASIAITMEKTPISNDVITVIGHRQHRSEATHLVELADSTSADISQPCAK